LDDDDRLDTTASASSYTTSLFPNHSPRFILLANDLTIFSTLSSAHRFFSHTKITMFKGTKPQDASSRLSRCLPNRLGYEQAFPYTLGSTGAANPQA
jgi:hypothetical protein